VKGKPLLRLLNEAPLPPDVNPGELIHIGERILKDKGEKAAVNVIFVDDSFIRALNLRHRGQDRPTDVLSFRLPAVPGEEEEVSGEVYISLERAMEQASEFGTTPADEIKLLLVHGLLHLFGYRDETPEERKEMEAESMRYLK